jgi:hypothetical protein
MLLYYRMTIPANSIPETAKALQILPLLTFPVCHPESECAVQADDARVMIKAFGRDSFSPLGDVGESLKQELLLTTSGEK